MPVPWKIHVVRLRSIKNKALLLWTDLLASSICLWFCKVCLSSLSCMYLSISDVNCNGHCDSKPEIEGDLTYMVTNLIGLTLSFWYQYQQKCQNTNHLASLAFCFLTLPFLAFSCYTGIAFWRPNLSSIVTEFIIPRAPFDGCIECRQASLEDLDDSMLAQ